MGQGAPNVSGTANVLDDPELVVVAETSFFLDSGSPAEDYCPSNSGSVFDMLGVNRSGDEEAGAFER